MKRRCGTRGKNLCTAGVYILLQLTWGLPQSLVGLLILLLVRAERCERFCGAVVTEWEMEAGLSMGLFIFMPRCFPEERRGRLLLHEYGHTLQSLLLGPLYLPMVALPSVLWANLPQFRKLRRERGVSYYDVYPEKWADHLGEKAILFSDREI